MSIERIWNIMYMHAYMYSFAIACINIYIYIYILYIHIKYNIYRMFSSKKHRWYSVTQYHYILVCQLIRIKSIYCDTLHMSLYGSCWKKLLWLGFYVRLLIYLYIILELVIIYIILFITINALKCLVLKTFITYSWVQKLWFTIIISEIK